MRIWTKEEIKFLKNNYKNLKYKEIAQKLNRTESSIWGKCYNLRLIKERGFCDEKKIIKKLKQYASHLRHSPSVAEIDTTLLSSCRRCFGGFNKAKEKAKLETRPKVYILPRSAYFPSKESAYIVGVLLGDGSFRFQTSKIRKSYVIIFASKDKDFMDYFIESFNKWSRYTPVVSVIEAGYHKFPNNRISYCQKAWVTQICFKEAWYFLKQFQDKPLFCLKFFPKKYWKRILKGLWDAEGSVSLHGPDNLRMHFVNSNPYILNLYKKILKRFDFIYSIYTREGSSKDICIYKPTEAVRFINKIKGITIRRKLKPKIVRTINFLNRKNINFKQKVYEAVKQIPKGKTSTYSVIAQTIGYPRAWRAVGNVLNKNRDLHPPKFSKKTLAGKQIPCHRVIRLDRKIGGYNRGIKNKIALLKKEGLRIEREKISF